MTSDPWRHLSIPHMPANEERDADLEHVYGNHRAFMEAACMMEEMSTPRTSAQRAARMLEIREEDERGMLDRMARD